MCVIAQRHCSKPGCSAVAVATLTYDYRDSTVVVGPLATVADPNSYDLCDEHAQNLKAPLGWQVVRLATNFEPAPPSVDDLAALVDAVRRVAQEAKYAPASSSEAAPSAESRTVTDASGQEVTLPAHPSRVVTLSEPTTDNALALGVTPIGVVRAAASRPSPTTSSTAPETSRSWAPSAPPTWRPLAPPTRT